MSVRNLQPRKTPSTSWSKIYNLSPKLKPDAKPPLHQHARSLGGSECHFTSKQGTGANKEPCTKETVEHDAVSLSPEQYIKHKSEKKMSRPRQPSKRLADCELDFPLKQNCASMSCTEDKKKNASKQRRCTHCQMTVTPMWREGPSGKGTLCNACGLMWLKSRTLFPEYRPANSPTFVSNLHSNVLHKVLKMRVAHQSSGAS